VARRAVPGAVALLLVGVAVTALWPESAVRHARAPSPLDVARDSIAGIDGESGAVRMAVPLPGRPTDLAASGSMLFATTVNSASLTEVDARTRTIARTIPLAMTPVAVAVGAGAVWIADGRRGRVVSVRIGYDRLSPPVRFGRAPPVPDAVSVAVGRGAVWATDGSAMLARIDPRTRRTTGIRTAAALRGVSVGAGAVWAVSARPPAVLRIDPRTNAVAGRVGLARDADASPFPAAITATKDAVWVLSRNTATVTRIDAATLAVAAVLAIGAERVPNDIAAGAETVWVANDDGTLTRIDATTNAISAVTVGDSLRGVAADGVRLWAAATALDQQLAGGAG
jgi:hypothetical protein